MLGGVLWQRAHRWGALGNGDLFVVAQHASRDDIDSATTHDTARAMCVSPSSFRLRAARASLNTSKNVALDAVGAHKRVNQRCESGNAGARSFGQRCKIAMNDRITLIVLFAASFANGARILTGMFSACLSCAEVSLRRIFYKNVL